jgi:hypothetical protein
MLALTNTPSAERFGLQTASLSRAGDDVNARSFVKATDTSLTLGVSAMAPNSEPSVLEPVPTAVDPGAYPLTNLAYAVVSPLLLDSAARSDYAAFITYGTGAGQVSGDNYGQLPRGYTPLPNVLRTQALAAAKLVTTMTTPVVDDTTTTTSSTTTTTTTTATSTSTSVTVASEAPTTLSAASYPAVVSYPPVYNGGDGSSSDSGGESSTPPVTDAPVTETSAAPLDSTPPSSETSVAAVVQTTALPSIRAATTSTPVPSVVTPNAKVARSRYAVPGIGVVALGSALGALEISKRPRRGSGTPLDPAAVGPDSELET